MQTATTTARRFPGLGRCTFPLASGETHPSPCPCTEASFLMGRLRVWSEVNNLRKLPCGIINLSFFRNWAAT